MLYAHCPISHRVTSETYVAYSFHGPHFGFWPNPNTRSIYALNSPSLLNLYLIRLKYQLFNYSEFGPRETALWHSMCAATTVAKLGTWSLLQQDIIKIFTKHTQPIVRIYFFKYSSNYWTLSRNCLCFIFIFRNYYYAYNFK